MEVSNVGCGIFMAVISIMGRTCIWMALIEDRRRRKIPLAEELF
jgi:hypothetical protein